MTLITGKQPAGVAGSSSRAPLPGGSPPMTRWPGTTGAAAWISDVLALLDVGLVQFDAEGREAGRNAAAERLLPRAERLGASLKAAAFENLFTDWEEVVRAVLESGQPRAFDLLCSLADASQPRYMRMVIAGSADGAGGVVALEDISGRVGVEQRLAASERLAALGELAARVAHELNNPLDGILRYVNLALRATREDASERVGGYLEQARTGLMRMVQIVRSLLEYSRGAYAGPQESTVNALIEEAVKCFEKQAAATRVSIFCGYQSDAPVSQSGSLFQVFCNLVKNSLEAMPDGGTLTIRTRCGESETVISFEDSGVGLPPERDRLFEPFFTTKPAGKGTGLGLAVCRQIVERFGGTIAADARRTGGAVFTVRLPRRQAGHHASDGRKG